MKKILVALAISLGASTAYAQVVDVSYGRAMDSNTFFTQTTIGLPIVIAKTVTVTPFFGWKTWSEYDSGLSGKPFRDTYTVGGKMEWNNFYVDVYHFCTHDVVSNNVSYEYRYQRDTWMQAQTIVSIGYKKTFNTLELF
jgi:hypothetical protein